MAPPIDHKAEIRRLLSEAAPAPAAQAAAQPSSAAIVITGGTVQQLIIVYGGSATISQGLQAPSCPAGLGRRRALLAALPPHRYKDKPK